MFSGRKWRYLVATLVIAMVASLSFSTTAFASGNDAQKRKAPAVEVPLNIAILIQDDLISQVANERGVTADFIRSLPSGSQVMVGYITSGTLQVRQPFTTNVNRAANSLRIPIASTSASAYNPYVEVIEALKKFDANWKGHSAVLLISDGLDTSRGFD